MERDGFNKFTPKLSEVEAVLVAEPVHAGGSKEFKISADDEAKGAIVEGLASVPHIKRDLVDRVTAQQRYPHWRRRQPQQDATVKSHSLRAWDMAAEVLRSGVTWPDVQNVGRVQSSKRLAQPVGKVVPIVDLAR